MGNLRKGIKREQYVRICPKCGSIDVQTDFSNPAVWTYGTTTKYKCNSCGKIGTLFPEILESDIESYKKELKQNIKEGKLKYNKEELVDASSGFFAVRMEFVIILIILITILLGAGNYLYNEATTLFTSLVISIIFLVVVVIKSYKQ